MFLRNVSWHSTVYTALYARRWFFSNNGLFVNNELKIMWKEAVAVALTRLRKTMRDFSRDGQNMKLKSPRSEVELVISELQWSIRFIFANTGSYLKLARDGRTNLFSLITPNTENLPEKSIGSNRYISFVGNKLLKLILEKYVMMRMKLDWLRMGSSALLR
jgi:hypothetical protein